MSHIIDIILVAVVLLIVFLSSKRGFILTVLDLVSGIFAFIAARFIAPPVSVLLYDAFAKEFVITFLTDKYVSAGNSIASAVNNLSSVFDFLPDGVYTYVQQSGILDGNAVSQNIMNSITTVEQLESGIVAPIITAIIQLVAFAVLSILLLIVFRIAARLISKVITISKIADKLNSLLGAAFGLLKGLIYVFIIAVVISVVSYSSETIAAYAADSYICSFASTLIGI